MGSRPVGAGGVGLALLLGLAAVVPPRASAQTACGTVAIRSPFAGDSVNGAVPVLGSARIEGFGFYKLEWASSRDPEGWKAVSSTYGTPVRHGLLDVWDTTRLPDGTYRLRLVVVDQSGQEPCRQVVDGLRIANDAQPDLLAAATVTPTVAIRAARQGELPPPGFSPPDATPAPSVGGTTGVEPGGVPPEGSEVGRAPGSGETTAPPTSVLAELASRDFPLEVQRGAGETDAETVATSQPSALDAVDPSSWIAAAGVSAWPKAFAGGALAALLVAVFGLLVVGLRRPR